MDLDSCLGMIAHTFCKKQHVSRTLNTHDLAKVEKRMRNFYLQKKV
jgi:hypothetical protein